MSLKNILVAYNGTDSAGEAVGYALKLARHHDAHLTGVLSHGIGYVAASLGPWAGPELLAVIEENEAKICAEIAEKFTELTGEEDRPGKIHWRDVRGDADDSLIEIARCFDLIVMGQDVAKGAEHHHTSHPDAIALRSGKPVLVVPKGYAANGLGRQAVLAWDGRGAAARALSDALPLLEGMSHLDVITVELGEDAARATKDVVTHLARHGIMTEHRDLESNGGIARTILDYCGGKEPGLLVMGAYEHSKMAEDLFGGTTNRVLREAPVPVLMSH